ncbi:hypothetical protein [Phytobacter diazotrophicus]|uniref:hypothetical protein n=1 Tax=Phytobacter diazotrophicus TaxID=395631 RepID=UPI002FF6E9AA
MTDRELLELAANAIGGEYRMDAFGGMYLAFKPKWNGVSWNPLENDGDALRLAVKLGIEIHPDRQVSEIQTAFCVQRGSRLVGLNNYEEFGSNEMAATRRAIVRAAAEIGRELA